MGFNSVVIAVGVTFFSLLIGVPQGFFLERTRFFGRPFFAVAFLVPLLIPPYIHAIVWIHLMGKTGLLNIMLIRLFHLKQPLLSIYTLPGVIFVLTLSYVPFVTAFVMTGLKSMDRGMEETALLQHAPFQVHRKITLPLLTPHIACGAVFVFVFSLINFGVPDFLRIRVYTTEIFIQFSAFYDEKTAVAFAVPLLIFALLFILSLKRLMENRPYITIRGEFRDIPPASPSKPQHIFIFLFLLGMFVLSTLTPLSVLVIKSKSWSTYWHTFKYSLNEIGFSLILGLLGAAVMTAFSFLIAYIIERKNRWSNILDYATLIPFAVPSCVLGIGLIKIWNQPMTQFIYANSMIILIAYIAHFIPFTVRILVSDLKKMDPDLEAAACLGTSSWSAIIRKIVVPLMHPGLLISFFIGFTFCFSDLSTTLLTIPPGRETLPIKIYNLMHYGAEHMVAALSITVIAIVMVIGSCVYAGYRRLVAQ